jgi:hypothetical protein
VKSTALGRYLPREFHYKFPCSRLPHYRQSNLQRLLLNAQAIQQDVVRNWGCYCSLSSTQSIPNSLSFGLPSQASTTGVVCILACYFLQATFSTFHNHFEHHLDVVFPSSFIHSLSKSSTSRQVCISGKSQDPCGRERHIGTSVIIVVREDFVGCKE